MSIWSKIKETYTKIDTKVGGVLPGGAPVSSTVKQTTGAILGIPAGVIASTIPKKTTAAPPKTESSISAAPKKTSDFAAGYSSGATAGAVVTPMMVDDITKIPDKVTEVITKPFTTSQDLADYEGKMITAPVRPDQGTVTYQPAITTAPESVQLQSELKTDVGMETAMQTAVLDIKAKDLSTSAQAELTRQADNIAKNLQAQIDTGAMSVEAAQKQYDAAVAAAQKQAEAELQKKIAAETAATEAQLKSYYAAKQEEYVPKIETQQKIEQKSEIIPNLLSGAVRGATYAIPYVGPVVLGADIYKTVKSVPDEISFLKAGGKEAVKAELISLGAQTVGLTAGGLAVSKLKSKPSTALTKDMAPSFTKVSGFGENVKTLVEPKAKVEFFKKAEPSKSTASKADYGLLGKSDLPTVYDIKAPAKSSQQMAALEMIKPVASKAEPVFTVVNRGISEIQTASLAAFKKASTAEAISKASEKALTGKTKPTVTYFRPEVEWAKQQQLNRLRSGADVLAIDLTKGTAKIRPSDKPFVTAAPEALKVFDVIQQQKPKIPEIQALALENLRRQQTKPIEYIAEPQKKITFIKFEEPKIPEGYTTAKTKGGLIQLVKQELKTKTKQVPKEKVVVFEILSSRQIAELASKAKQAAKTKLDIITTTRTATFAIPRVSSALKFDVATKTIPRLQFAPAQSLKTASALGFKSAQALKTSSAFKSATKQDVRQAFAPRLDVRTRVAERSMQNLRSATATLRMPSTRLNLKLKPQEEGINQFLKPKKSRKVSGFDVLIKRRGKYKALGVSLTRAQAGLLAQKKLKESLAASAMLKESGKAISKSSIAYTAKPGEFRQYQVKKGTRIFNPNLYIQKSKFRLGTRAEKTEIQIAKKKRGGIFY